MRLPALHGPRLARICAVGAVLLAGLSAGCAAPRSGTEPSHSGGVVVRTDRDLPASRASDPEQAAADMSEARRLIGLGRPGAAVDVLDALLDREPRYIPAHRLLQDLLIDSPADWDLRLRYPTPRPEDDADAFYLAARIEPDREQQVTLFEAALDRDPDHPWARVGRALTLLRGGDFEGAALEAHEATRLAPELAMPWLFLGSLYLSRADLDQASAAYAEAVARDPDDVRGRLGMIAVARDRGERGAAASAASVALRIAPGDPYVLLVAGQALVSAGVPRDLRAALGVLDAAATEVADPVSVHVLRARLLLATGDGGAAREACDVALAAGAGHAQVGRVRRRAAVVSGDYSDAVEGYLDHAPAGLSGNDNLYAARWNALRGAATAAAESPSGSSLLDLGEALVAVGWRAEAALVLARAQALGPEHVRRRAARRAAEERAFDRLIADVAVMARTLRAAAQRGEDVADVGDVLAVIGGAARRRLGRDVTAGANVRSYPFLGEFAVTVGSDGAFAREFDSRGLLLLVGRRRGDGTRIVVGRLAMVRAGASAVVASHPVTFDECWLETDGLPRDLAGLGGGLAGLTMDRLVLIQLDTVLRGASPPSDIALVERAAEGRAGRIAVDTPSAVAARIEADLQAEGRLATETLAAVRCHELGHVLDAQRMLPIFAPPWRAVGLVLRHGFDGAAVESHLEARAAVVALADGGAPRAALASLLGFLPETDGATAHVRGYVAVVREMVRQIEADPASFPSIRRDRNILQQMDGLTPAEATELGRRVLRGL